MPHVLEYHRRYCVTRRHTYHVHPTHACRISHNTFFTHIHVCTLYNSETVTIIIINDISVPPRVGSGGSGGRWLRSTRVRADRGSRASAAAAAALRPLSPYPYAHARATDDVPVLQLLNVYKPRGARGPSYNTVPSAGAPPHYWSAGAHGKKAIETKMAQFTVSITYEL